MASPPALRYSRTLIVLALGLLLSIAGLSFAGPASAASDRQLAGQLVAKVNAIRKSHHLAPLTVNSRLVARADSHSRLIQSRLRLANQFPGESPLSTGLRALGYQPKVATQTVGWSTKASTLLKLPAYVASSPTLRGRMLGSAYTNVGIAVRYSGRVHRWIVTMIFARPVPAAQAYAASVLRQLNAERAAHHLRPLRSNSSLISSAHTHNLAMARRDTMSHRLSGEAVFTSRISKAGYRWEYAGENIGWNSGISRNAALALQTTMYNEKAPYDGHRQNILSRNYTDVGIDVYIDSVHHKLWLTEDFGRH
ncbi:MAG: CAP domain-containing protein [Streptosporangiaceae bacterium]